MQTEGTISATDANGTTAFTCENCGATTSLRAFAKSIACPFCGSQYVIARPDDPNAPQPDALLPFNVPDRQVRDIYQQWLGSGFFRPRDLAQAARNHEMRAVYLPAWECSARAYSEWTATAGYDRRREEQYQAEENGQQVTKTRTVTETDWRPAEGRHEGNYPRELVSASKGLPQDWLPKLGDFEFGQLQSYNPQFLAGREVEECALDHTSALEIARQQIEEQEKNACAALVPGDRHRDLRANTQIFDLDGRLLYLPVWLASFQYQDRVYRCIVNGQTGTIGGEAPVSKAKVTLVIVGVIAAIILLIVIVRLVGR
jgi:DNA-directed RNA polymerase subunit RPC12/RpoP